MSNKTLYIKDEDAEAWMKAGRYLKYHEDKSVSVFLSEQIKAVVEKYEGKPGSDVARRIITSFIHPPIPCRSFDWCAHFDDEGEEAGRYGWGATEAEAIKDLKANHDDQSGGKAA